VSYFNIHIIIPITERGREREGERERERKRERERVHCKYNIIIQNFEDFV